MAAHEDKDVPSPEYSDMVEVDITSEGEVRQRKRMLSRSSDASSSSTKSHTHVDVDVESHSDKYNSCGPAPGSKYFSMKKKSFSAVYKSEGGQDAFLDDSLWLGV